MITKAIFGIKYSYLSNEEILFIKKYHPYGIIFFERNIESINQFKSLINHIKSLVNYDLLFVIDHEGGKINRFNKIFSQKKYSARYFGEMYNKDRKKYKKELDYFLNFNVNLFKLLGINTVAYPVLDILYRKTHKIIKDRCFSSKKTQIVNIAKYVINFYQSNKISCISKHAPGHGLSTKDSHLSLPIVKENKKFLMKNDFETFKNIKSHYMMTAHIHYKNFDKKKLFLFCITILPIIFILLVSLISGARIRTMWMSSFYLFFGILFFYFLKELINLKKINRLLFLVTLIFVLSPVTYLYISLSNDFKRTDYPGKEISNLVQNKWDKNFVNKIEIVIGDEWSAGNLSYHLKSRPIWFNELKDAVHKIDSNQGVIYTGNPKILEKVCPGVYGTIKPVGYCMIGQK